MTKGWYNEVMDVRDYGKNLQERIGKYRETPRYTTILHEARTKLGLSLVEYCVVDSVHYLSHRPSNPYCTLPKDDMADFLGVNRATIFRAIKEGLAKGLVEKNERGDLRSTEKWIQEVVVKKEQMKAKRSGRNA